MAHSHSDDLRLAHLLADTADSISMEGFGNVDLTITTKSDLTFVTQYDTAVEESIRRTLRSARSRDIVLGEEEGEIDGTASGSERRWIVDPIDGTHNYMRGVPVWGTLIGLEEAGEIVVGVVSAPALGRRWWAARDLGATTGKSLLSSRRIAVSDVSTLESASLSYASLHGWDEIDKLDDFLALLRRVWRTRGYGDFWSYMLLAEGSVDIAAEPELNLWDMAALDIIVREAGGRFTNLSGEDGPWGANALATNGRLHDLAMAYVGYFPDDEPDEAPHVDNVHHLDFSRGHD